MYKTKLPTGVRVLLGFLSVILCILLFASTLVTIIVADVRLVTSKDGLQNIITQALFPTSAPARPVGALAAGVPGRFAAPNAAGNEAQGAIVDAIYGMLTEQFGEDLPISQEQVEQFLSDSTVPEFLSEKVAGIVNDIYTGKNTTTITKDEVVQLLTENADLIKKSLGVELTPDSISVVGDWVEQNDVMGTVQEQVSQITGMAPPTSDATGKPGQTTGTATPGNKEVLIGLFNGDSSVATVPAILQLVRTATSVTALLICIGTCLLIIGLLLLTHWGRPFAAVRSAGIPVLIAGLFMSVPAILAMAVPSLFTGTVLMIVKQILSLTGYIGYSVAGLGLVMIVAGAVLNSMMKKKAAAAAAEDAEPVSVGTGAVEDPFTPELTEQTAEETTEE